MPTANRRQFVPRAIRYFQRQDYPEKELVIVDDGTESVADLIPDDPQIRYVRLAGKRTLGAKRNQCVEASRGDLIMHWDDDDWMAPHRLTQQVQAMRRENAEICGLRQMLFYEVARDKAWLYTYPAHQRLWLAGGSLLYTREFWRRAPFPNIQIGSDTRFVWAKKFTKAVVLSDYGFYIAMIHTSPKTMRGPYWKSLASAQVHRLLGEDLDHYRQKLMPPPGKPQHSRTKTHVATQSFTPPATQNPCVTVSIPFRGSPHLLKRAVESILRQTYTNLRVIVLNDGDQPPWQHLALMDDPRLVRFDLPFNRGRYFADAVALSATDDPFFLIQDADDWSEPQRVEKLLRQLRAEHAIGAVSAQQHHLLNARSQTLFRKPLNDLRQPLDASFKHRAD